MSLNGFPVGQGFHYDFAPNLMRLDLFSPHRIDHLKLSNVKYATIGGKMGSVHFKMAANFDSLEDLTFLVDMERNQRLLLKLPNLKTLRIKQVPTNSLHNYSYWMGKCQFNILDSSGGIRMLDELHLIDVPLSALASLKARRFASISQRIFLQIIQEQAGPNQSSETAQNSSERRFSTISKLFRRQKDKSSVTAENDSIIFNPSSSIMSGVKPLVDFLGACSLESEIVALDEASDSLLADARERL
jgi:hypothetical protein